MPVPRDRLEWMHEGEVFFLDRLSTLSDDALREPSALPGWSRAHVVSHFSRNARALINLLDWARTGVATPMYPSMEARAEGIEDGSHQTAGELRAEAREASGRLEEHAAAMPDAAWDGEIRTALGRVTSGAEVPWMRVRETWVHGLDLDAGARADQIPEAITVALLDEVAQTVGSRDDSPSICLEATDSDGRWQLGPGDAPIVLQGTKAAVLAWLLGRSNGDGLDASSGVVPDAPRWL
jgi:maleylpyruvate isomerase